MSILTNDMTDNVEELLLVKINKELVVSYFLKNKFKEHPVTFGDFYIDEQNNIKPFETVLTYAGGQTSSRRLDYIFHFTPKTHHHPKSQETTTTEVMSKSILTITSFPRMKLQIQNPNFLLSEKVPILTS